MPTYDYQCDACGHRFEEFQSMKDEPLRQCPECRKKKLRRLLGTGAAILFKGSGFYQTDYRSDSYKSAAKADEKNGTNGSTDTAKKAGAAGDTDGTAGGNGKAGAKKAKSATRVSDE
jgi:putative FmdB family regulatory protein